MGLICGYGVILHVMCYHSNCSTVSCILLFINLLS